jgi:hypothetical protein
VTSDEGEGMSLPTEGWGQGKWHKARSTRDELANRRLGRRDELANKRLEGNYYILKNILLYDLVISAFLLLQ